MKKIKIEFTEKQLRYLREALFEFGDVFPSAEKEYMFKKLSEKLYKAKLELKKSQNNDITTT